MFSDVLESFGKKEFLRFVSSAEKIWETDAVYSGEGYSDDRAVCFIMPGKSLIMREDSEKEELKDFLFSDERPACGFLSYDFGLIQKGIPSDKDRYIELGHFKKYRAHAVLEEERLTVSAESEGLLKEILSACESKDSEKYGQPTVYKAESSLTKGEYLSKTEEILENIRDGEVYQLNLSMMYSADVDTDPFKYWLFMADKHPAPFYAYFNSLSGQIISTSPERFLKVAEGKVLTQPIKGTYHFSEYSSSLESVLTESVKESAELSMIVDLLRNDISESCVMGSVKVLEHKSVMRVDNLLQMYSSIEGELDDGKDVVDLLWSAFPGGSVTGCPKKRAMELIEELEPHSRGIYCGSIFVIDNKKNMDSNIAIRTGFYQDNTFRFFAGSGIVADSDPQWEYTESVNKAEKFLKG